MTDTSTPSAAAAPHDDVDLDAVARDLDAVQAALDRLNDGTYWTDEVTGAPLPDDLLAADPTARTSTGSTATGSTATDT